MNSIIYILKHTLILILISLILSVPALASDFDLLCDEFSDLGADTDDIISEDQLVSKELCEGFLNDISPYFHNAVVTSFSQSYVTKSEYISAVLGFVGYSSENGDFLSEFPYDKAAEIGILKKLDSSSPFLCCKEMLEIAKHAIGTVAAVYADAKRAFVTSALGSCEKDFIGLAYSGADITVSVKPNFDVSEGFVVNSDKVCSAVLKKAFLSLA